MTKSVAEQEFIPYWCENCDRQGYIFIDDPEQAYFVVCKTCARETSYAWCPKCGMGGEFVEDVPRRPKQWRCPDCQTQYRLPQTFYENKVPLIATADLSDEQRQLVNQPRWIYMFYTPGMFSTPKLLYMAFQFAMLFLPWFLIVKFVQALHFQFVEFTQAAIMVLGGFWLIPWTRIMKVTNEKFHGWEGEQKSK